MAFPQSIHTYLRGFRADLPVMLGRVRSSASSTLQGAVQSILYDVPQPATGATWVSVDTGLLMSWKARPLPCSSSSPLVFPCLATFAPCRPPRASHAVR